MSWQYVLGNVSSRILEKEYRRNDGLQCLSMISAHGWIIRWTQTDGLTGALAPCGDGLGSRRLEVDLGVGFQAGQDVGQPDHADPCPPVHGACAGELLEPTLIMCIEAFANSMLVSQGHVTFKEVYAAFKTHFPLVRSTDRSVL